MYQLADAPLDKPQLIQCIILSVYNTVHSASTDTVHTQFVQHTVLSVHNMCAVNSSENSPRISLN